MPPSIIFRILTRAVFFWLCVAHLPAAPTWLADPSVLGSVNIHQSYAGAYPIGPILGAPEFGLSLQLVHGTTKRNVSTEERDRRYNEQRKRAGLPLLPPPNTQPGKKPVRGGTYGWRTAGSSSPGGRFIAIPNSMGGIIGGNQFYTLRE